MNKFKKITAGAMASGMGLMAIGGAATAFAADDVKISVAAGDKHTYDVYQLMTGDYSEGTLSNLKWGSAATKTGAVSKEDIAALTAVANGSNIEKLEVINGFADLTKGAVGQVSAAAPLENLAQGYYLVKDANAVGDDDAYTLYIVEAGGNITVTRKSGVPTVEKKVKEGDTWQEGADASVGDTVEWQLTGTLPDNYDDFEEYTYIFHDTLPAGLDFTQGSVVVTVGDNDVTDNFEVSATGNALTVSCNDLKKPVPDATKDTQIVVTYKTTVNEKAVIGDAGNVNQVKLEYSNNPNAEGTGNTTPDDAKFYTYKLVINKLDGDKAALAGAQFQLERKIDGEWKAVGAPVDGAGDSANVFTWERLDAGDYRLKETKTPAGYNTIDPVEFSITSTIDGDGNLTALATTLTGKTIGVATGETADMGGTADKATGEVKADVVNVKGITLPKTGATGAVILMGGAAFVFGGASAIRMKSKSKESE